MQTLPIFLTQFVWFFIAWALLAKYVAWPGTRELSINARLRFWIAPQMFRALGLGLLVPQLSPGLAMSFALPTALVDFFTAMLAVLAFIALNRNSRLALPLTWACTIIGLGDLLIAFSIAPFIGVSDHLAAQWLIPAIVGPLMIVAHVACLATLLESRSELTTAASVRSRQNAM